MSKTGFDYAPSGETKPVVEKGEFVFATAYLDHGHIYGQTNGLLEAGGVCKWVYDSDPQKIESYLKKFPGISVADSYEQILDDQEILLVNAAAIPNKRYEVGEKAMRAGKDYFTDKSPFTTLEQLERAKKLVKETHKKYMVYFSERLHTEAGWHAGELISQDLIGDVLQVLIIAPHRLSKSARPDWFFDKEAYGGILTDIGSHQFEQFLTYAGVEDAVVKYARVANFGNPDKPGLEDFGEAQLITSTGSSCYCRVDWWTPDGMPIWGDGRTFVLGTKGTLEVRKYLDIAQSGNPGQRIYLTTDHEPKMIECEGKVGYPFFGELILDLLNRTEKAMTQEHVFKAAELSLMAQEIADSYKD
ncbi:MAG: Gfo/Idh/MocA family oxidoreductase [Verrucomicrobiota bacterium]